MKTINEGTLKNYEEKYEEMRREYLEGTLTSGEWHYFCEELLERIMNEHKDVLQRLKNR